MHDDLDAGQVSQLFLVACFVNTCCPRSSLFQYQTMDQPAFYSCFSRSTMKFMSKCFWDDWNQYEEPKNLQSTPPHSRRTEQRAEIRIVPVPAPVAQNRPSPLRQRNERLSRPASSSSTSQNDRDLRETVLRREQNKQLSYKNSGLKDMPWLDSGHSSMTEKRKRCPTQENQPPNKMRRLDHRQISAKSSS